MFLFINASFLLFFGVCKPKFLNADYKSQVMKTGRRGK